MARVPSAVQPTALALVLALVAWPIVAMTWGLGYRASYIAGPPGSGLLPWTSAGGAVFLSALVAGPVGGLVVRRGDRVGGALFTIGLAMTVAIVGATLLPAYLGQNVACWDDAGLPCDPITTTVRVIIEDLQSLPLLLFFAPLVEPAAVITLELGVGFWAVLIAPSSRPRRRVGGREGADEYAW